MFKKIAIVLSVVVPLCLQAAPASKRDVFLVGTDASYPPFQFRDEKGTPTGFEIDLLKRIGEEENFDIKVVYKKNRNEWQSMLDENVVDIFVSAFLISDELSAKAEVSQPTISYNSFIYLLDNDKNKNRKTVDDFHDATFAGNKESLKSWFAAQRFSSATMPYKGYDTFFLAFRGVLKGEADALIADKRVLNYLGKRYPQFKYRLITTGEPEQFLAFTVKKGRKDLINRINAGLVKLRENGGYDAVVKTYFEQE